eukprot:gene10946-14698_t
MNFRNYILQTLIALSLVTIFESLNCDLILSYVEGFGVGLYAGKDFEEKSIVEEYIAIPFPHTSLHLNPLDLYADYHNETHSILTLGLGSLVNHAPRIDNITITYIDDSKNLGKYDFVFHNGRSEDIVLITPKRICNGDQIFTNYGREWFSERNIEEKSVINLANNHPDILHIDDIQNGIGRIPGCPTMLMHYDVSLQTMVANYNISKGTVIEVSRVLLIPEYLLLTSGHLSELAWFRQQTLEEYIDPVMFLKSPKAYAHINPYNPYFRYGLVVLGNGMLLQSNKKHQLSTFNDSYSIEANVNYDWWDLSEIGISQNYNENENNDVSCVSDDNFDDNKCFDSFRRTKSGFVCDNTMFVIFKATKDIVAGEELLVDLDVDLKTGIRYPRADFSKQCL